MKNSNDRLPFINEKIRAPRLQVIAHDGENVGIITRDQALLMADQAQLDLVMMSESGPNDVPIVKIMDYGKVLYDRKKKQAEAKKHQKVIQVKEIKMRPKIGEHDYQTKMKKAIEFLLTGKRVKFTLSFRGRENILKETHGSELFKKIDHTLEKAGLAAQLVREKDMKAGPLWSRVYYLKAK